MQTYTHRHTHTHTHIHTQRYNLSYNFRQTIKGYKLTYIHSYTNRVTTTQWFIYTRVKLSYSGKPWWGQSYINSWIKYIWQKTLMNMHALLGNSLKNVSEAFDMRLKHFRVDILMSSNGEAFHVRARVRIYPK